MSQFYVWLLLIKQVSSSAYKIVIIFYQYFVKRVNQSQMQDPSKEGSTRCSRKMRYLLFQPLPISTVRWKCWIESLPWSSVLWRINYSNSKTRVIIQDRLFFQLNLVSACHIRLFQLFIFVIRRKSSLNYRPFSCCSLAPKYLSPRRLSYAQLLSRSTAQYHEPLCQDLVRFLTGNILFVSQGHYFQRLWYSVF